MAVDPVCQMEIDEKTCKYTSEYKGKTYYFCAPGCKMDFDDNPEKYLKESADKTEKKEPPPFAPC
ncbi:MAG: YHS domain-containing protein [Candidatus Caldatribacteriota bacterium]|jgi:YHS domain-containing protein